MEDVLPMLLTNQSSQRPPRRMFIRAVVLTVTFLGGLLMAPALSVEAATLPSIAVGSDPYDVVVDSANGDVYVTNQNSNTVSVINSATNQVVATLPVGLEPMYLGTNPLNGDVYVGNNNAGDVSVINAANQVVNTISVASTPSGMAVDTATGNVYVSQYNPGTVSVIGSAIPCPKPSP